MSESPVPEWRHSPEVRLRDAAERLYGPEWSRPVSEATGIGLRTVQRVAAAINAHRRDPRADSILSELRQRLGDIVAGMTDVRDSLTFQIETTDALDDPLLIPTYLRSLSEQCEPSAYGRVDGSITLWRCDLRLILRMARAAEDAKNDLLQAAAWLSRGDALNAEDRATVNRVIEQNGEAGAATLIDGQWRLLRFPWAKFPFTGGQPQRIGADHAGVPRAILVACNDQAAVAVLQAWVNEAAGGALLRGPIQSPLADGVPPGLTYLVLVNNASDALDVGMEIEDACDCTAVAVGLTLDEQAQFNRFYNADYSDADDTPA